MKKMKRMNKIFVIPIFSFLFLTIRIGGKVVQKNVCQGYN